MHAQKGPRVWLEYDYRFRVRTGRTDTPWNRFIYPLYSSVKLKCNAKAANTSVSAQPFLEYASGSTRPRPSRFCFAFNKGKCQRSDCRYTHGRSFCKKEGHSQLVCRGKAKLPYSKTHYRAPLKQVEITTWASNDLLIQGSFTKSGSVISTQVKPNVLTFLLQGYDTNITKTLVTGFTEGFRIPSTIISDPPNHHIEDHKTVRDNQGIVQRKLSKEKAKHRIAGPFTSDPFPNMVYSPLGLVPKKESGKFRLIHDLSFPKTNSVNTHILPEFTTVDFLYFDKSLPMGCSHECQLFMSLSQALQ